VHRNTGTSILKTESADKFFKSKFTISVIYILQHGSSQELQEKT